MESATPFRLKAPRDSEGLRHVIPTEGAHPFRAMTPIDSDGFRLPASSDGGGPLDVGERSDAG